MLTLSTLDTRYVKVPVAARISGVDVDPTTDTVEMCAVAETVTPTVEWEAATWETDSGGAEPVYVARLLLATPAAGRYMVWVKIVHGVETMVERAGLINVR